MIFINLFIGLSLLAIILVPVILVTYFSRRRSRKQIEKLRLKAVESYGLTLSKVGSIGTLFLGWDNTLGLLVVINGRKGAFQIFEVSNTCSCHLNKIYQGSLLTAIEMCFLDLNGKVKGSLYVYQSYAENWMQLSEIEKQADAWEMAINRTKENLYIRA